MFARERVTVAGEADPDDDSDTMNVEDDEPEEETPR
jgi:hypothetical protein